MAEQQNLRGIATTPSLVMFDLDGTLVDSLADLAASVNFMRRAFGLPPSLPGNRKACRNRRFATAARKRPPEYLQRQDAWLMYLI